jgi:hypothetical protein
MVLFEGKIHGNARAEILTDSKQWVHDMAEEDPTLESILGRQDIKLFIQMTTGTGDQETRVVWDAQRSKTVITVNIKVGRKDTFDKLQEDLAHELIVHAGPIARKHIEAVAKHAVPDYPLETDSVRIENEETADHLDVNTWYQVAYLMIDVPNGLDRAIIDMALYDRDVGLAVIDKLEADGLIDDQRANELRANAIPEL